ncbi:ABC transporter ATP-binding protein [Nonomuraea sp. NPDC048826]|uniref:ABC transporter ATP-binding protein n=1 Tax=Nonomuraea sp. NPDC048826 TaxID=3364347 RepID=UPI003713B3AE
MIPGLARRAGGAIRLIVAAAPGCSILLLVLTLVEGVLPAIAAWGVKLLLDEVALGTGASAERVVTATTMIVLCGLLLGVRGSVNSLVTSRLRRAVGLLARDRLLRRVNAYPGIAPFEDPDRLNRLKLAEQSGEQIPEELPGAIMATLRGVVMAAGFVTALLIVWPPVVALLLAAAVPTIFLRLLQGRRRAQLDERVTPLMRRLWFFQTLLTDARAAKEVRLFGLQSHLHGRTLGELRRAHAAEARLDRRELRTELLLEVMGAAVAAGGAVAAAYLAISGRISIGDVSVFLAAVGGVHTAIGSAADASAAAYRGLLLFSHYQDLVDEPEPEPERPEAGVLPLRRGIELRDVWFRYGDDQAWVLRGVDLVIPYGAAVALVGRNGAGKSTLVKLLCRFYEPTIGAIFWDGVDLRSMPVDELRARIGAVFQDFMTYDLTAAENIGLGRLALRDDRAAIRAAAGSAGIDAALAALPGGYDTLLSRVYEPDDLDGASGLLSGGQWQRLALARAFLRADADLMILDEPSAGLDAEAEHQIHQRLAQLRSGRTSVLISHRLCAARDADTIVVLDQGQVIEQGGHGDLMAADGTYARLFRLQADAYRRPDEVAVT